MGCWLSACNTPCVAEGRSPSPPETFPRNPKGTTDRCSRGTLPLPGCQTDVHQTYSSLRCADLSRQETGSSLHSHQQHGVRIAAASMCPQAAQQHPYVVKPSAGQVGSWVACGALAAVVGCCFVNPDGGDYNVWIPQVCICPLSLVWLLKGHGPNPVW